MQVRDRMAGGPRPKEAAMPAHRLQHFLEDRHVKFDTIAHDVAYTAQEIAALTHIRGRDLAKTVMVKLDDRIAMVVVPASMRINFELLRQATGAQHAELAHEWEFKDLFPECELGAMPPFGNLYGLEVYVEHSLSTEDEIVFNAGSHTELIRMPYRDFERLVQPRHVRLKRLS
jgi:Ala-tRNA(Pro) deacylase